MPNHATNNPFETLLLDPSGHTTPDFPTPSRQEKQTQDIVLLWNVNPSDTTQALPPSTHPSLETDDTETQPDITLHTPSLGGYLRTVLHTIPKSVWIVLGLSLLILIHLSHVPNPTYELTSPLKPFPIPLQNLRETPYFHKMLHPDVSITAKAKYRVDATVMSAKTYDTPLENLLDRENPLRKVIPVDLALLWGIPWTDEAKQHMQVWQSNRWYYYQSDENSPYGQAMFSTHSSNNHLIPATENLRRLLHKITPDTQLSIEGYLVDVHVRLKDSNPQTLASSISREDTGGSACEIIYVTRITIGEKRYE